jgi:hypothetical protein
MVVMLAMAFLHFSHRREQELETQKARDLLSLLGEEESPPKK